MIRSASHHPLLSLQGFAACLLLLQLPPARTPGAPPVCVSVLLDASGLHGQQKTDARNLPAMLLRNLPPGSVAEVFVLGDPDRPLANRSSKARQIDRLMKAASIEAEPGDLANALRGAIRRLAGQIIYRPFIVLLTDGQSAPPTSLGAVLKEAQQAKIAIIAVGIKKPNQHLLAQIAEETGGASFTLDRICGFDIAQRIIAISASVAPYNRSLLPYTSSTPSLLASSLLLAQLVAVSIILLTLFALRRRRRGSTISKNASPPNKPHAGLGNLTPHRRRETLLTNAQIPLPDPARETTSLIEAAPPLRSSATKILPAIEGRLKIEVGPGDGNVFPLSLRSATILGQSPSADVKVLDPQAAPEHCKILPAAAAFFITAIDLDKGTFVNDERIGTKFLCDGDSIRIGRTLLKFSVLEISHAASN
jgi:hypothetical protein